MGATESKPQQIQQDSPPRPFVRLNSTQRARTFDDRREGAADAGGFRPLTRSTTFDTRQTYYKNKEQLTTVQDVLYRRYFNAQPVRIAAPVDTTTTTALNDHERETIVVVDPFSSGMTLAQHILDRGYSCVCVYSDTLQVLTDLIAHVPDSLTQAFSAIVYHTPAAAGTTEENALQSTAQSLHELNLNIVAVLAGAETGVRVADGLSEKMRLRTNGTDGSDARRNKYSMGEKIRRAGLRAVKQCSATKWSQVVAFIQNDLKPQPFEVIVKPAESAGSDDVTLCRSMDQVKAAFGNIQGKINGLGLENKTTLVQEYLNGTEYVVDTVSRDGKHKVVAVWEYDKRAVNGAPFVYYGLLLRPVQGPVICAIVDYVVRVLDVLGIVHGPGHAEVKFVNGEPCLVEIGSRCHGGEGSYKCIVNSCIGYNQIDVTIDAFVNPDAFDALTDRPTCLKQYGCEAMLVSYEAGMLVESPGLKEIQAMESYLKSHMYRCPGETIHRTVDMFTTPGSIMLVHDSEQQLNKDYARIRELEQNGLFVVEPTRQPAEERTPGVVVVDPFSTGAVVAKHITDRGYKCICLYSDSLDKMEHVASLVPAGLALEFAATVAKEEAMEDTIAGLYREAAAANVEIVAVLPGAETGVLVCDEVCHRLSMKGNKLEHSSARRNKYEMGETLRRAGLRAVKQCKAESWEQAKAFIETELIIHDGASVPLQVVLKPLESAGTDDVSLCTSLSDAERVFHGIIGKVNGLGLHNSAVLIQEYLEGTEYVIDTVSCDGKHKVVAVWEYDKRRVNDAAFVYFGVRMVEASCAIIQELIQYELKVLDALGIENGPAHGEVKHCRGEPVLIEVGARCHGGEGSWIPIANRCVGYNQVDVSIDAYLDCDAFASKPDQPTRLLEYGCEAMLVSYHDGILHEMPGLVEVEQFASFLSKEMFVKPGDRVTKTIDMFTTPGSIMLVHRDLDLLNQNLARIRELERSGMYTLEEE